MTATSCIHDVPISQSCRDCQGSTAKEEGRKRWTEAFVVLCQTHGVLWAMSGNCPNCEAEKTPPLCIYCDLPVSRGNWESQVQVVYGGLNKPLSGGTFIRKDPGKKLYSHHICGLPDPIRYSWDEGARPAPWEPTA